MIQQLKLLFNYKNKWIFFAIAFVLNIIYWWIFNRDNNPGHGFYFLKGDAIEYMEACENLFNKGFFYYDHAGIKDYTNRMPGMAVVYLPLRFFFSRHLTLSLFILFQLLYSAIAKYYLARIAEKIFKRESLFYWVFVLAAVETYLTNYNSFLYTESLAISSLILSVYFFLKANEGQQLKYFFMSGLFLAWLIFLRPYMGVLLPVFMLQLLYAYRIQAVKMAFIFLLPFSTSDSAWTLRNYHLTGKFVPLMKSALALEPVAPNCIDSRSRIIRDFGFHWVWWDRPNETVWFLSDEELKELHFARPGDELIPQRIFNGGLTIDSLKIARDQVWCYQSAGMTDSAKEKCNQTAIRIFNKFEQAFKKERPFEYSIGSRLRLAGRFLNQPLGGPLKSIAYPFNVVAIFLDSVINYFVILFGFIGVFIYLRKGPGVLSCILFIPLYILVLFPGFYKVDELRYLTLAYPFLLLAATSSMYDLYRKEEVGSKIILFSIIALLLLGGIHSCAVNIKW